MLLINVAPSGSAAIVKMAGKIESEDGPSSFAFMTEVIINNYDRVLIDLSECEEMDSTFMGMLLLVREKYIRDKADFYLINVSDQNMEALNLLGIPKVVPIKKLTLKEDLEWARIDLDSFRREGDRIAIIEMAHKALAAANAQNAEKFGSFLRLLEAEMSES